MRRRFVLLTFVLVAVLLVSGFVVFETFFSRENAAVSPFYVGVEFGYGNASDCRALVDKVKNYTNLLVISSTSITENQAVLNDTCDYAFAAGLHLIVYFPQMDPIPGLNGTGSFHPYIWAMGAKDKYGDTFLGCYICDENGGEQLDGAADLIGNYASLGMTYQSAASNFVEYIQSRELKEYSYLVHKSGTSVITADYGLYWWDYAGGFDAVLAEFGWGNNRQMAISLCRGAARVQSKDWGAIICWQNSSCAVMESGPELYADLTLAYDSGAKYAVIFDYAGDNKPNPCEYGILTEEHFGAMKDFWNYVQQNPAKHGSLQATTALVLPAYYGFGFRRAEDLIWGFGKADAWTQKIWNDTNNLLNQYGSKLDIVYSDPEYNTATQRSYAKLIEWSSGSAAQNYPVLDLNSTFGYDSIQAAVNSGATSAGDTIYVKPGTYYENVVISKPLSLIGAGRETTIIDAGNNGSAIAVTCSNVTVEGFTLRNGNTPATVQLQALQVNSSLLALIQLIYGYTAPLAENGGIGLNLSDNCTFAENTITDSNYGVFLSSSSNNVFRNNILTNNKYSLRVSGNSVSDFSNDFGTSNTVNGKPICYWVNQENAQVPANAGSVTLVNCTNIIVKDLNLTGNYDGLLLVDTQGSTIANNTLTGNYEGLRMVDSQDNVFRNNNLIGNTFSLQVDGAMPNDLDSSNRVDGKPVYYWVDQQDKTVPVDAGYVALINCNGITVQDMNLTGAGQGILLANTTGSTIIGNSITKTDCGIDLVGASKNFIAQNTIAASQDGIKMAEASSGNFIGNNLVNGSRNSGITLSFSTDNQFAKNQLTNNYYGVLVDNSSANMFDGNSLKANVVGMQFGSLTFSLSSSISTCTCNTVIENNITLNQNGVIIYAGVYSETFYHNNFINNTGQVSYQTYLSSTNFWDNGKEGNYWSSYNGTDANGDGLGDQAMVIYQPAGTTGTSSNGEYTGYPPNTMSTDLDHYPLMKPYQTPNQ